MSGIRHTMTKGSHFETLSSVYVPPFRPMETAFQAHFLLFPFPLFHSFTLSLLPLTLPVHEQRRFKLRGKLGLGFDSKVISTARPHRGVQGQDRIHCV